MRRRAHVTLRGAASVEETLANVFARWASSLSIFCVVFVMALLSVGLVISETSEIGAYQQRLYDKGATGFIIAADDGAESGISATRCDELNHVSGVVSAGARGDLLPNVEYIPVRQVSSGYLSAVFPGLDSAANLVAGPTIASSKHFVSGSGIVLANTNIARVDIVPEESKRDVRANREVLLVTPAVAMSAKECIVIASVSSFRGVEGLLTNWFTPQRTSVSPLAANLTGMESPQDRLDARSTFWVPIWGGGMAVVTVMCVWISRRADFALYRLLGVHRSPLILGLLVEYVMLVLVPSLGGIGFALVNQPGFVTTPAAFEAVALAVLQFLSVCLTALPVGVLILLSKNPSFLIRQGA